jgi:hypothetical protein
MLAQRATLPLELDAIENVRQLQSQVRIVGDDGAAVGAARRVDGPAVRCRAHERRVDARARLPR